MYVCMYVLHSVDGFTSLFLITPVLQIVSEISFQHHKQHRQKYKAIIFTTIFRLFLLLHLFLSPCPFSIILHIPFLSFAFCLNSVSEGNWETRGVIRLSGSLEYRMDMTVL